MGDKPFYGEEWANATELGYAIGLVNLIFVLGRNMTCAVMYQYLVTCYLLKHDLHVRLIFKSTTG